MKIDLIKKFKWYIIGFILVAIMLSVSLSFCSWDNMSLKAKAANKGSGWFNDKEQLYTLEEDNNNNYIVDVGDIVSFGNYYQDLTVNGDIGEKTPIRWIVVEKENNQLTLLAEKVMAFGNFWGNYYNDGTDNVYDEGWAQGWKFDNTTNGFHYQNYSTSTLRAWLNSYYESDNKRSDAGAKFSSDDSQIRFRGFFQEAFLPKEQKYILSKTMSGMKGYGKDNNPGTRTVSYGSVTDKVWVPAWSEVYGTTMAKYEGIQTPVGGDWNTYDGEPKLAQFKYFEKAEYKLSNSILQSVTTAFASSQFSNYTVENAKSSPNMQNSLTGDKVWWWLRSPSPSYSGSVLVVRNDGCGHTIASSHSYGGVRPAVIIPA